MNRPANGSDVPGATDGNAHTDAPPKRPPPLFEVIIPASVAVLNGRNLYHFKIWPDGHIEGFEGLGKGAVVHNRLPQLLISIAQPIFQVAETLDSAIDALTKGTVMQLEEPPKGGPSLVVPGQ